MGCGMRLVISFNLSNSMFMLPRVHIPKNDLATLLAFTHIGDVVDYADSVSMDIFKEKLTQHPDFTLDGIDTIVLQKAIATQTPLGIPEALRDKFIAIASDRQQFKRAIIKQIVESPKSKMNLNETMQRYIIGMLEMGVLFDQFIIEWR